MKKINQGSMHERRGSLFDLEDGTFGAFDDGHDWRVELHAVYEQAQARLAQEDCSDARAIVKAWEAAVSFDQRGVAEAIPAQMFLIGAAWQRIETSIVAGRAWGAGAKTIAGGLEGARSKRLATDEERVNAISNWLARNPSKSQSAAFRWLETNANLGSARTLKRAWTEKK
jgi:hypothetical protein